MRFSHLQWARKWFLIILKCWLNSKYLFKSPLVHPWKLEFLCQISTTQRLNGLWLFGMKIMCFYAMRFLASRAIVHNQFKVFMKSHIKRIHASFYNFAVSDSILHRLLLRDDRKCAEGAASILQTFSCSPLPILAKNICVLLGVHNLWLKWDTIGLFLSCQCATKQSRLERQPITKFWNFNWFLCSDAAKKYELNFLKDTITWTNIQTELLLLCL